MLGGIGSKYNSSYYVLASNCCVSYLFEAADWGPKIDVVGFCFLDLASNYVPPDSLENWLKHGKKPIYIGFGSLVSILSLHSRCSVAFR